MPMLTATTHFEHRIKWYVRNFHMLPPWRNVDIVSPEFSIRLLDVISLRFYLRSLGPGKGMAFAVSPDGIEGNISSFKYQRPFFDFRVIASNIERTEVFCVSEPSKPTINSNTTSAILPLDPLQYLEEGTLVLLVTLKTTVDQDKYWSQMLDPHLVYLTNTLVSMVSNPTHGDFLMESGGANPESVETHSCILRARMPCLFRSNAVEASNGSGGGKEMEVIRVVETGVPSAVLKMLLYYLYGRLSIVVPHNLKGVLLRLANFYELENLARMLTPYPTDFSIITSLVIDDVSFDIEVADINWENLTPTTKSNNCGTTSTGDLDMIWAVTSDKSIMITYKFPDFNPQDPLYLRSELELRIESGKVINTFVSWHTFTDDSACTLPQSVTKSIIQKDLITSIRCRVHVTKGGCKVEEGIRECSGFDDAEGPSLVIFNDLLDFRDQLRDLYVNQVGCDFELDMGSWKLRAHKAIVMARSPSIRKKVESREEYPGDTKVVSIKLKDYWEECYNVVLIYMYSGIIKSYEEDVMDRVVTVADYLGINYMTDHCSYANYGTLRTLQ